MKKVKVLVYAVLAMVLAACGDVTESDTGLKVLDNVQNNVTVGGNDTFTAGGSTDISYRIVATSGDGQPGCNASDGSPAVVTINTPAGVTASPNPLSFSACSTFLSTTFSSNTPGNYPITVSVADPGQGTYNTTPANLTLKVLAPADSTPPVITPSIAGTLGDNGWYTSDVTVSWSVVDNESAVSSTTGCGSTTITTDQVATSYTCSATSSGGTASETVSIKRDATAPTLSPSVSPNPVLLNGSATATPNASDNLSGVTSESCEPVDTTTVGSKTVSCSATDNAGNGASGNASYSVIYDFNGFFRPVDMNGVINTVKAGSAVPVKFSLGGNQGLAILAPGFPKAATMTCTPGAPTDPVEETVTAGSSSLSYDVTTDQYVYVWKTDKGWTGCRQLQIKLADGQMYTANFKLNK